jgi:hypothetical protein
MGLFDSTTGVVGNVVSQPSNLSGMYSQYGVDQNSKKKASELSAAITRQQFNDYQARFSPYLSQLNNAVSDSAIAQRQTEMTGLINQQAGLQPQSSQAMTQRNLSRYGAAQDPRAQGYGLRMAQLDSAANAAKQINQMNSDIKDTSMALMSGQKLTPNA